MNDIFIQKGNVPLTTGDYDALLTAIGRAALVSVTDSKGDIIYANDKFVEISKYTREELLGQNHRILKSGHQPYELFVDLWKTISNGGVWRGEIKNRAKDGSYYWVDSSIAPILGDDNKPERYIAIRFPITDKKVVEENIEKQNRELKEAKDALFHVLQDVAKEKDKAEILAHELEKFKIALDGTSDHVVITDQNGIILYANAALERITGFSPKEVVGKKAGIKELWGGNMEQEFYAQLWHTIKIEKKPFVGEITNRRKNGVLYQALSSISPILTKDGDLEFFIGIERDITKEKEIDQAKTEFVSLASHQLRTPLSTVNWYAEMLLSGDAGAINEEQKKYLDEIYKGNQRMVELVNALLNVSRLELGTFTLEPEPTDIIDISRIAVKEVRPMVENKKITLSEKYAPDIPKVNVDPKLTRIIFQNLISNAAKYTPENGTVDVTVELRKKGDAVGGVSVVADSLYVAVADTGYGIPKAQEDKIFTKLFRADNVKEHDTEGTGLGLYIIKSIVEHSKGKVWFVSQENKGTTFHVLLPLTGMKKKEGGKYLS